MLCSPGHGDGEGSSRYFPSCLKLEEMISLTWGIASSAMMALFTTEISEQVCWQLPPTANATRYKEKLRRECSPWKCELGFKFGRAIPLHVWAWQNSSQMTTVEPKISKITNAMAKFFRSSFAHTTVKKRLKSVLLAMEGPIGHWIWLISDTFNSAKGDCTCSLFFLDDRRN